MGKSKKRRNKSASVRRQKSNESPAPAKPHLIKQSVSFPLPFPSGLPFPKDSFLRNESPYEHSFQSALDTAYEGLAVDLPSSSTFPHDTIEKALHVMEDAGFFRKDVTQPFGLGTKLSKTYVTRCLVGERGTTYKYLGLRMFAHPWDGGGDTSNNVTSAVDTIRQLNDRLTERTAHHLSELGENRCRRGGEPTRGRAGFDIALINRMESTADLKKEPSIGEGRCSVSWHADSCLEHYSTIAVYQTIVDPPGAKDGSWSVALRVSHNSEGPDAKRRGTDIESTIVTETPPLAISLPSRSVYYLLDDFNHHHQHAVLASGGNAGVRFSSTHRLLRESHNVNFVIGRCKKACSNFHKKGPKIWRSEQLLHTEVESEWIRQFYIQGQQHYDLLWKAWGEPMTQLLHYWSRLESRTKQTIDFLQAAAEGSCFLDAKTSGPPPSRAERKKREKRKKALDTLNEIVGRTGKDQGDSGMCVFQGVYEPFADLLAERAEVRRLWAKREADHVFHELDRSQRPLSVPFVFGVTGEGTNGCDCAFSPMPGSPGDLRSIADKVKAWGRACESKNQDDLPTNHDKERESTNEKQQVAASAPISEHSMPSNWEGWATRDFGLEMQSPWAGLLLEGKKTIETRAYDLPPALLGRRIGILQSKEGGRASSLGNVISLDALTDEVIVKKVGSCTFVKVIHYTDRKSFEADEEAHLVKKGSTFGWKDDITKSVYGWVVGEVHDEASQGNMKSMIRRHRSLFELQAGKSKAKQRTGASRGKKKKRKRY